MQCSEADDEFGSIAERRIEQPSDPFAYALCKLFRGVAHPPCKGQNGKGRGYENEEMPFRSEEFEADRDRDEDQQPVHRSRSTPISR